MKTENSKLLPCRNNYARIIFNLHKRITLLSKITSECTIIYPTNLNEAYARRLVNITRDIHYTLLWGYEKPKLVHTLIELSNKLVVLKQCWEDGRVRGLVPLIEKEIVVDLIKQLKREIIEDLKFTENQKSFLHIDKSINQVSLQSRGANFS
jgi:hypothetical protein